MKIDTIVIDDREIKVRRGHREQEKKWFERTEAPKVEYKRKKSNSRWWEEDMDEETDDI